MTPTHGERDTRRVAAFIAHRRADLGLTQTELAERAGVDAKTIGNIETGKRWPWARNIAAIESALRVEPGTIEQVARGALTKLEAPSLVDATDAELLAEIARRFARTDATSSTNPTPLRRSREAVDEALSMAARTDEAGVVARREAVWAERGEESQDPEGGDGRA